MVRRLCLLALSKTCQHSLNLQRSNPTVPQGKNQRSLLTVQRMNTREIKQLCIFLFLTFTFYHSVKDRKINFNYRIYATVTRKEHTTSDHFHVINHHVFFEPTNPFLKIMRMDAVLSESFAITLDVSTKLLNNLLGLYSN